MVVDSLRTLAILIVAMCALGPAPAAAVTLVDSCRTLDKAGETYILTANINANGTCFVVLADRITLDLSGNTITGPGVGGVSFGVSDNQATTRTSTVVKNGTVTNFVLGIALDGSRNTVRNVTASGNQVGMAVGINSLVKDCIVQSNFGAGIAAFGSQVEGCLVGGIDEHGTSLGNSSFGIVMGGRMLVTRNTVIGNGGSGIATSNSGTVAVVSHNTVIDNGGDGISVGAGSLVTSNTANVNDGDGIRVACPATVTHNTALDNGGLPINPPTSGKGCVVLHNVTSDGGSCLTADSALAAC